MFPEIGTLVPAISIYRSYDVYCKRITLYIMCLQEFECARLNPGERTTD